MNPCLLGNVKGKIQLEAGGEFVDPAYITRMGEALVLYTTDGDEIRVLSTLLNASLEPGDNDELLIEGLECQCEDPEDAAFIEGQSYIFRRFLFRVQPLSGEAGDLVPGIEVHKPLEVENEEEDELATNGTSNGGHANGDG